MIFQRIIGLEPKGFRCEIPYCDANNDFDTYNSSIYARGMFDELILSHSIF